MPDESLCGIRETALPLRVVEQGHERFPSAHREATLSWPQNYFS